jgi:hypothetical protein
MSEFSKKITIVIIYRDRCEQIADFLVTVPAFLDSRGYDWSIIIAEQCNHSPFNRGFLINLGYLSGQDIFPNKHFTVFSDVDTYPVDNDMTLDYRGKWGAVRHVFCGYEENIGGIVCFDNRIFESINGFPNNLWGWGHEDFAAKRRLARKKLEVDRTTTVYRDRPDDQWRFRSFLDHERDTSHRDANQVRAYVDMEKISGLANMPEYTETRFYLSERIVRCIYRFDPDIVY